MATSLPVPYLPPKSRYDSATPALVPLLQAAAWQGAILGVEWTTLKFIEDAPLAPRVTTFVISILLLVALQYRDWLRWKRNWYFPAMVSLLIVTWLAVFVGSYIYTMIYPLTTMVTRDELDKIRLLLRNPTAAATMVTGGPYYSDDIARMLLALGKMDDYTKEYGSKIEDAVNATYNAYTTYAHHPNTGAGSTHGDPSPIYRGKGLSRCPREPRYDV